jgi:hypothetical protein
MKDLYRLEYWRTTDNGRVRSAPATADTVVMRIDDFRQMSLPHDPDRPNILLDRLEAIMTAAARHGAEMVQRQMREALGL